MNPLLVSSKLITPLLSSPQFLSPLFSSPHLLSPFLSSLRGNRSLFSSPRSSWKRNNINNNNNSITTFHQKYNNNVSTKVITQQFKHSFSSSYLSSFSSFSSSHRHYNTPRTTTFLVRGIIENGRERGERRKGERSFFHSTQPKYAGVHAFRLASFVAPIVMRGLRGWIGTPSTNAYFKRRLFLVLALLFGLPGIYIFTHLESTPYTDRVRFVAMTSDDEFKLGEMAFNQLVDEHIDNFIPGHHRFVSQVTEVANRIIEASDRPDIKWEVRLIDSTVSNAFAIPGGKIFVFSGLLDVTQNDDGLAFILGHEVAHVLARHGAEQMTVGRVMLGFSVFLSAIFGDNIGSFVVSRVISLLTELKYSRNMEREADYIGLLLMSKAKYDISEAPRVWERMMKQTGDNEEMPFLSTHPSHGDRIHDISKWVEEIKAEQKLLTA